MADKRPAIPRPMKRAVQVEAGHRCAVPTCRETSGLEVHHIVDFAKVQTHDFDNLILLCGVCHARATEGEIDRQAMLAYKANLGLLKGRYSALERRVLDHFVRHPAEATITIDRSHRLLLAFLVEDGLLEEAGHGDGALVMSMADHAEDVVLGPALWRLTDKGRGVVENLRSATILE